MKPTRCVMMSYIIHFGFEIYPTNNASLFGIHPSGDSLPATFKVSNVYLPPYLNNEWLI